CMHALRPPWTF
nr:immunoglobulin light chain junction region [Macaca mulatta]